VKRFLLVEYDAQATASLLYNKGRVVYLPMKNFAAKLQFK